LNLESKKEKKLGNLKKERKVFLLDVKNTSSDRHLNTNEEEEEKRETNL